MRRQQGIVIFPTTITPGISHVFRMSDEVFERVRMCVNEQTGICFQDHKTLVAELMVSKKGMVGHHAAKEHEVSQYLGETKV